jgi:peptidoglycan/xylan/chitin deacetylase (PgdA/CDA1 family)
MIRVIPVFLMFGCIATGPTKQGQPSTTSDNAYGVPVLIFHQVVTNGEQPDQTVISFENFANQMQYLADNGYNPISIRELVAFMDGSAPIDKPVVLTFDDGWKNTLNAIPILKKHGFKASFFVITGAIDGNFGNDYMTWSDVKIIAEDQNFEIASHAVTHPWDPSDNLVSWGEGKNQGKSLQNVRYELAESKHVLEKKLGRRIKYFAWPCGWYNDTLIQIAEEVGYTALLTTRPGKNIQRGDFLRIKRYTVDGSEDLTHFIEMLLPYK